MERTATRSTANQVFISYSHCDRKWLDRLLVHLRPLVRNGQITIYSDKHILTGTDWRQELETALETARIAALLISANFLNSDFIMTEEVPRLLARAADHTVAIMPIIISPSLFETIPALSRFQAANDPSKPLDGMTASNWNKALVKVAHDIQLNIAS